METRVCLCADMQIMNIPLKTFLLKEGPNLQPSWKVIVGRYKPATENFPNSLPREVCSHEQDQDHRKTMLLLFKKRTSLSALNHILFPQVSITSHNETVPACNNGVAFCLHGSGTILLNELSNWSKQTLFPSLLCCNLTISRVSIHTCSQVPGDTDACWASCSPSRRGCRAGTELLSLPGVGKVLLHQHLDLSLVHGNVWASHPVRSCTAA